MHLEKLQICSEEYHYELLRFRVYLFSDFHLHKLKWNLKSSLWQKSIERHESEKNSDKENDTHLVDVATP